MNEKIMATLENLEEKIENIKWLIASPFSFKKSPASEVIGIIRRSCGLLCKARLKGVSFENSIRRQWNGNLRLRKN